jgi:hypothetical protein
MDRKKSRACDLSYKYKIEKFEVVESIVVDVWREEISEHRRWSIDTLTSHVDHIIKHKDNRNSITRCRQWLFNNYLELFI